MLYRNYSLRILLCWLPALHLSAAEKVTYEAEVLPILREHCFACHNQDDATASLALDSYEGAIAGGAGGEVLAAGDAEGSRLWKLVTHQEEPTMPPGGKLPQPQLDVLRSWIEGGLLKNAGSKPLKSKKPQIAKIDAANLGKPVGEPAMPEQLFQEPVLWRLHVGPIDALATSPWAPLVAIGWQRQISFYDTNTFDLLGILPYVEGVPRVVRFSRDGSLLLVAGGEHAAAGSAALFDVKTGARLATLGDELDIVLAADISPDLALVAIGGPKKKVRVYRVADGELAYDISKHTEWITALGFSPDGRFLATADRNGGAFVWQAAAGHERGELRGHSGAITALDWRADSAMLATASEDGTARLWNPEGKQLKSISAHGGVLSVRFAQDGNWVTTGRDRHVRTWKPDGGGIADLGELPGISLAAAFTHDNSHVIASDYTGEVRVIDVASKQPVANLAANPPTLAQRFATAEATLQQTRQKAEQEKQNEATRLAALKQAQAVHTAHKKKLAEAQSALETKQQEFAKLTEAHAAHEKSVATTRQVAEQATAKLAAVTKQHEAAQAQETEASTEEKTAEKTTEQPEEQLAELKKSVELARAAETTAQQKMQQAEQELNSITEKKQDAEASFKEAETTLARVAGETAGLPNLDDLRQQHDQAKAALATAQQQLQQAEQVQGAIAEQQTRFANATSKFASETQGQQERLQKASAQVEQLQTEHQQAAARLAKHTADREQIAQQLKALRDKLQSLKTEEAKSKITENELAARLEEIQSTQAKAEQLIDRLESQLHDFNVAEELRKRYENGTQ